MCDILERVPESHHDLVLAHGVAVLSTVGPRGRPQSTALWYLLDDDGLLKSSVTADRQKYKNLRANPNCSLLFLDLANPHRTLELRGEAELVADPDLTDLTKIAEAYDADVAALAAAGSDRHTIVYRPRRVFV